MYLKNKRCYLSGAIQFAPDGYNWRENPKKILSEEFGIEIFDPFADPKQQWKPQLIEAQKTKDYETMTKISRQFLRKDLCMVDRSDFLIAYLQDKVPTTGTVHEIINSSNAKKPTLLVTNKEDIADIPAWYFGFIPFNCMFAGWDALYDHLREVDQGKHMGNNRWHYIYGLI